MKIQKTVTDKQLAANRLNAQRSTGPRTARGKSNSRFNAVKAGLFAGDMVIPSCDGKDRYDDSPKKQFAGLLEAVYQEFKPQGPCEVFWVEQIAESMWKQRRMSRSERALVHARKEMNEAPLIDRLIDRYLEQIRVLDVFLEELETGQICSLDMREELIPLVDLVLRGVHKIPLPLPLLDATNENVPDEARTLDQFVASLRQAREELDGSLSRFVQMKMPADYDDARALPREEDMAQILRYDKASQKKFDRALERLLQSQQRRQKSQALVGGPVSGNQSDQNRISAKRSH